MEDKLNTLLSASNNESRYRFAREWQKEGKKVIGILGGLIPEEVIYAAGMLPWQVQGSQKKDVPLAK